tara:strand:- start:24 stop:545 length:522 start_codon:yes stop_codon:yes gene_type:complete
MAGQLVQVDTETVSSAVASVTLTGIDSDDVYMLAISNLTPATVNADMKLRVTESGTASPDSDYDRSAKLLRNDTTFSNLADTNTDGWLLSGSLNNTDGKGFGCIVYIYNANNSSEYTFTTHETAYMSEDLTTLLGIQGGGVYTQTTAVDGVNITMVGPTSDIQSGTFTLYKIV